MSDGGALGEAIALLEYSSIAAGIEAVGNVAHDIDWEDDELDASDAQPSYTLH